MKYSASGRPDSQIGVPFVAGNIQPIDQADVGASVTVDHSLEFPVSTDGSQLPQRITNTKVWMNAASSLRKPFVEKKFKPVKPRKQ